MISDLPSRHKLHGQIRNKRNIMNMKRVRAKSALCSNRKRGSIDDMNSVGKKDVKKKDEQNEESYRRNHQNQDTKDKHLTK
jgi:hypothetical protein